MNPRYPAMAALLAASLGASLPGTSHAEPQKTPAQPSCPPKLDKETDSVNILAAIIACDDGTKKADIGERLVRFVLSADNDGPLFVSRQIQESTEHSDAVAKIAKEWPKKAAPAKVAELYFVMGDAEPPAWVANQAVLKQTVKAASDAETDMRKGLKPALLKKWRKDNKEEKIAWQGFADDTALFLSAAADAAHAILADPRVREQIRSDVAANEQRPGVPVAPNSGKRGIGSGPQFSYEDMYLSGGAMAVVKGPKDAEAFNYYLKLETHKDPTTGDLKTYVGVYDVNVTPCYIRRVPIIAGGPQTIQHASGRWNLVVDIKGTEKDGDLSITLRRPDDKDGSEGGFTTTASQLGRARFDQAKEKGQIVSVGGQDYYVLGQGGGVNGVHLFYNASLASRDDVHWRELRPELAAVTSRVGADGDFLPLADKKPDLGSVLGKDFHLEYNAQARKWEVKDGKGDPPPPIPGTAAASGAPASGNSTDVGAALGREGGWQDDADAQKGLTGEAARRYRIQSRMYQGQKEYNVVTPSNFFKQRQSKSERSYGNVTGLRGVGHYIVVEANGTALYQNLLLAKVQGGGSQEDFEIAAQVDSIGSSGSAAISRPTSPFSDFDVLTDVLKRYMGYSDDDVATVVKRVGEAADGGEYWITAAKKSDVFIALTAKAHETIRVWPTVMKSHQTDNKQVKGSGTVIDDFDVASSEGDVPLPETLSAEPFRELKRVKMDSGATAALYHGKTEAKADKPAEERWYLVFKYREKGGSLYRTGQLLVFATNAEDRDLPPDIGQLSLGGHTEPGRELIPGLVSVSRVAGSGPAKGVWALHKAPTAQVSEKSCVGPVLWWGWLTYDQAYDAACKRAKI